MKQPAHRSIAITDASSVGEARRAAMQAAQALGLDEAARSNAGIVATELANNVQRHGGGGELLVCPAEAGGLRWLDLLALDRGPGIADVERARTDGYSTGSTPGQGLGAIERLASASSLFTQPGKGTVHWARMAPAGTTLPAEAAAGSLNIPLRGETVCGDGSLLHIAGTRAVYLLVDGLGHGAGAHQAATAACDSVAAHLHASPSRMIEHAHDALRSTRGAAVSVAVVDRDAEELVYAGVGNVTAAVLAGDMVRRLVSQNGTVGATLPRIVQETAVPLTEGATLLMFSDGINSRCTLAGYPGLRMRPLPLAAGVLLRDFARGRDDASVLLAPLGGRL